MTSAQRSVRAHLRRDARVWDSRGVVAVSESAIVDGRSEPPPWLAHTVLRCHTVSDDLSWLPDDGVALSRSELERIFSALRALVSGTDELDPNRAHTVDIAFTIAEAIERQRGGDR